MTLGIRAVSAIDEAISLVAEFFYDDLTAVAGESTTNVDELRSLGFKAKAGETQRVIVGDKPVVVIGLGSRDEANGDTFRRAAGIAVRAAKSGTSVAIVCSEYSQEIAEGAVLGSYAFTAHKSEPPEITLTRVDVVGGNADAVALGERIARATNLARDLINEPPSSMTPRAIGRVAGEIAHAEGFEVEVWDHDRIIDEQLGGLLGVSRGSDEPPRFVKLAYEPDGANEHTKTVAIVGKGITFDSGGLSLKPSEGMLEMKTDMSGAAVVLAVMSTLPFIKPGVRVRGYIAASENMPGPSATKLGDVLVARNGKTMEVVNTDAEGRLVLSDALAIAVEDGADAIIDIATLTGAIKVALGTDIAGLFSDNDELAAKVQTSSANTAENVWRLPLHAKYRKHIDSQVADIKNMGSPLGSGSMAAAFFLKEFTGGVPWAHLDIAGVARGDGDDALNVKGGTGYGVRLLVDVLRNF